MSVTLSENSTLKVPIFPTQHYHIVGNTHRDNAVKSVLCNTT